MNTTNPILQLRIDSLDFEGIGISFHNDERHLVPFALPGELVRVRVNEKRKGRIICELVELLEASIHRVKPPCEYFGECGGCDLQHLAYPQQLVHKQENLEKMLAAFSSVKILPILPCSSPYHYRNRITLHHDRKNFGLYRAQSHDIVPIDHCEIVSEALNEKIEHLASEPLPKSQAFELREDGLSGFVQVNRFQNEALIQTVLSFCGPNKVGSVLELYCGAGNLTFPLAKLAKKIYAIDGEEAVIKAAEALRAAEKIKNIRFECAAVYDVLFKLREEMQDVDLIVCDPPREGLREGAAVLTRFGAAKIIYVSCDPASFVRDARVICSKDYALSEVQPIDMFPQTRHVEVVGVFTALR